MPIYEYRCKDCHQLFEEWCRHIEDEKVSHFCPICKGEASRLVSNTSFALKGGGWYTTEYGSHKGLFEKSDKVPGNVENPKDTPAAKPEAAPACKTVAASGANQF